MVGKIFLSIICFLLFVYVFLFKLIKKNDTTYLVVLVLQAIGILLLFVHIIFGIMNGMGLYFTVFILSILIPAGVFAIEAKGLNFSELIYIGVAKVYIFLNNSKKAKDTLIKLTSKYDKSYLGHKMLAEIYEQEGGMRKSIDELIKVYDLIQNPITINTYNSNIKEISEKTLKSFILRDIDNFLLQLGNGFSYIANEYKIKIGNKYNYIDILLFNYIYNCFVVVELKVTESKKNHFGQVMIYKNYVDKNIKNINQSNTIGIIVCKKNNKYLIEYSSDERIRVTTYKLV